MKDVSSHPLLVIHLGVTEGSCSAQVYETQITHLAGMGERQERRERIKRKRVCVCVRERGYVEYQVTPSDKPPGYATYHAGQGTDSVLIKGGAPRNMAASTILRYY